VLVAIPGGEYGGAERYAVRIAAAAAREGWEVAAAVRRYDELAPMRRDLHDAGVTVLQMIRGERIREFAGFLAMLAVHRPDVVHLTLPWPVGMGRLRSACALFGTPAVLVHQVVPDAAELQVRRAWLYRLSRRRRQRWVAVSAYGAVMLKRIFGLSPSDEIPVIHNAPRPVLPDHALSDAEPGAVARGRARASLGLDEDGEAVVTVGRLAYEKGHDVLIAAAARLADERPRAQILIAGEGAGRASLQRLIDEAGLQDRVRLIGQAQDVGQLLRAADVFAFPSRREGTPFALMEAMSAGVPVVAADFGGVDEIVDSGENGIVVPQDDPAALADAIDGLLRDPVRAGSFAERARERAEQFSEAAMLRSTLTLLRASGPGGEEVGPRRPVSRALRSRVMAPARLNRDLAHHALVQYRLLRRPSRSTIHGVVVDSDPAWPPVLLDAIYRRAYEAPEAAVLRATLRPDDRYLEIGAGIGVISTIACQIVGAERVTSFEANPALVRAAGHTLTTNGFDSAAIQHAVLGDSEEPRPFYVLDVFWESSLIPTPGAREISVPGRSWEAELERLRPSYLMIDAEGGEVDLLDRTLPDSVRAVCVEMHPGRIGHESVQSLLQGLMSQGFVLDTILSGAQVCYLSRAVAA
jgi:FkbM family methyltransferase